jgi:hypothetical protein
MPAKDSTSYRSLSPARLLTLVPQPGPVAYGYHCGYISSLRFNFEKISSAELTSDFVLQELETHMGT